MKTELIDLTTTQKQLVFEIPADAVEATMDKVTRDYTRSARIPGFRPGKAPAAVVRKRYKDQILSDVVQELIPLSLEEALRERSLDPVETPDIRDVSHGEGEPLKFTAVFETVPPIDPVDYAELQLRKATVTVEDQAVDSMMNRIADRSARLEPIEDRAAGAGDVLTLDVTRTTLSSPSPDAVERTGKSEANSGVSYEIGAPMNPPGFDDQVIGLSVGDQKTFSVTFPEDHAIPDLQGSVVEYAITLNAIRRKVVPTLDDEFAIDLGLESLEALRQRVRDDLVKDGERTTKREMRDDLLRQLASRCTVEVPGALVSREVDRRLEEFVRQLVQQGVDPMKAGIDWEDFRTKQREAALDTVKATLMLDDVAKRESIEVPDAEVEAELARFAAASGRTVEAVRHRLEHEGGLNRLTAGMQRERTVEFLMSRATIVEL
jgi:trigger factor